MSVATRNPFALLDEEASSPASKPAPAPAPAPTPAPQKPRNNGPAARSGKYPSRGGARSAAPREGAGADDAATPSSDPERKFGRGRGRGGDRGGRGRGGEGRPPRGGRAFDRHSQSGKVDSEKKVHQSWGGDDGVAELKAEEAATKDAAAEAVAPTSINDWAADGTATAPTGDWGAGEAGADAKPKDDRPPRREREVEEEDNTLTFDQYLAQKKEDSAVPKLEGKREANDGAAGDLFKGATQLQKSEEEETYFVGKGKSAPKARAKKEEKVYLEIDARFERPARGGERGGRGGGRGDRGGDRGGDRRGGGGRGRGSAQRPPRGGNSAAAVNVNDESAFPSLS